ncbi:hypothetical protein MHYP_G00153780 [Metynnis hypsauchen]
MGRGRVTSPNTGTASRESNFSWGRQNGNPEQKNTRLIVDLSGTLWFPRHMPVLTLPGAQSEQPSAAAISARQESQSSAHSAPLPWSSAEPSRDSQGLTAVTVLPARV